MVLQEVLIVNRKEIIMLIKMNSNDIITRLLQFLVINYHYSPRKYNITLQSNMWVSSLEIEKKPIFFNNGTVNLFFKKKL